MSENKKAIILLEDGTFFEGISCGAKGTALGEISFNPVMIGYPEAISDPCVAGQILVMNYPQIGNYGIALDDLQSEKLTLSALVVSDMCKTPSNFRSDMSLPELLEKNGIVAIEGIDTRELIVHVRDSATMKAIVSSEDTNKDSLLAKLSDAKALSEQNLVSKLSTKEIYEFVPNESVFGELLVPGKTCDKTIAVYDLGCKRSILFGLTRAGFKVMVTPWNTSADDLVSMDVDGVLFSSGPGNPIQLSETISAARQLLGKIPVFGIGLGHQILALAANGSLEKLRVGHHGGNYPAVDPSSGTVEITEQNHSYVVKFESLGDLISELSGEIQQHYDDLRKWSAHGIAPVVKNEELGRICLTHVNLNDGTVEGLRYLDCAAMSVQFHPGINPGLISAKTFYDLIKQQVDDRETKTSMNVDPKTLNDKMGMEGK